MPSKQRMRLANEKASKNVEKRGNVPKSSVRKVDHVTCLVTLRVVTR